MKKYITIVLIAVVIYIAGINIYAVNELRKVKNSAVEQNDIEINLKDHQTGSNIDIADPELIEELCGKISELRYGGIYMGKSYLEYDDNAYDLVVSSKELQAVFVLSDSPEVRAYFIGHYKTKVKNYEDLYECVKSVFAEQSFE